MLEKKILIVDDHEEILALVEKLLTDKGYEVVTATTGRQAQERIIKEQPDLVIMDILLPDVEGSQVIKSVKDQNPRWGSPVIFLTAIAGHEEGSPEDINVGGNLFKVIGKPFNPEELMSEIKKLLN